MDEDYAPLSAHCVRALCDKMYEKRKAAALEIEKLTKVSISSRQRNLTKTYHNEANTSGITKIASKIFLEFFEKSS